MSVHAHREPALCSSAPASSLWKALVVLLIGVVAHGCGGRTPLLSGEARDASGDARSSSAVVSPDGADLPPVSSLPIAGGDCPVGFTACGRGGSVRCFDLSRSADHCGQCGTSCTPGILCQASRCQQDRCKGTLTFRALPADSKGSSGTEPGASYVSVLGDFDGDGTLDFVGQPEIAGPMGLLLGNGDGTFRARPVATAFVGFWNAAAGDLNGDGRLDLASISKDESAVTVRLGDGESSTLFGSATTYPTPSVPGGLLLVDLDGDGHVDLVTAESQRLSLWRGTTDGRLGQAIELPVGLADPFSYATSSAYLLRAVDWNQDGVLDLLFGMYALRLLPGNGDGTFGKEIACGLALDYRQPSGVIADVDHDQKPDLVMNTLRGTQLYLGMNVCNYTTAVSIPPAAPYGSVDSLAVADLDGDENPDIVVAAVGPTVEQNHLSVYLGDGRGGFASPLGFPIGVSFSTGNLLVGDLNHDRKLDVVVTRADGWQILLNTCP